MTRHSKVFVQVSEASENSFSLYTAYSTKEWLLMEEKENVYVLTEQELKKFATDFFYWWYNGKGTNTLQGYDEFLQSKTNPQTENK